VSARIRPDTLRNALDLAGLQHLAALNELYFVLDVARRPALADPLQSVPSVESLFNGTPLEGYWSVAPYLLNVDAQTLFWLIDIDASALGIWAHATCGRNEVVGHFRELLYVTLPDGKQHLFRYYDPRVLPAFLASCDAEQLAEVFGPVASFIVGDRTSARTPAFEMFSPPAWADDQHANS
jgi:hypothetical protein